MRLIYFITLWFAGLITALCQSGDAQYTNMYETFNAAGKIYVVVAVLVIIFLGIVIYLITIDRKMGKLEKRLSDKEKL